MSDVRIRKTLLIPGGITVVPIKNLNIHKHREDYCVPFHIFNEYILTFLMNKKLFKVPCAVIYYSITPPDVLDFFRGIVSYPSQNFSLVTTPCSTLDFKSLHGAL